MNCSLLLCRPTYFTVSYVINPWMEGNISKNHNPEAIALAIEQWEKLANTLQNFAEIKYLDPSPDQPDLVFTANAGLVFEKTFICSRFHHQERQGEEPLFISWFEKNGFDIKILPENIPFEGAGDALFDRDQAILWAGYGFRSELESHKYLSEYLPVEVLSLRLLDSRFYHLDTCFCPLENGYLLYFPEAFDQFSNRLIESRISIDKRIPVSEVDACRFACNAVNIGKNIILNDCSEALSSRLESAGFTIHRVPLGEFMKSGGAAKCLTLRLNEEILPGGEKNDALLLQEVHFNGHILDTGILSKALDLITNFGGSFNIQSFLLGEKRQSTSTAEILVMAPSSEVLDSILPQLIDLGGSLPNVEIQDAVTAEVLTEGVAPDDFYVTTIFQTEVKLGGNWHKATKQRMDATLVIGKDNTVTCTLMRDLKIGDRIVVGIQGVRTYRSSSRHTPSQHKEFTFMGSSISSERKVEIVVEEVAWNLRKIRESGGKTIVSAGPVVVHTGGGGHLAWLIREGYVSGLLGGNAIAVHDMEQVLMGTSLGVDLLQGIPVQGGHKHHLRVINSIRRFGSIKKAVEQGFLNSGIMYECIKNNVPFSLAGSVRDDGPLPDTKMDLIDAQAEYSEIIQGADLILLLSSMLQSIGVGNMTPAGVKLICVDINPAVVTKLSDRGSVESTGVVTDVGLFLGLLVQKLKELTQAGGDNRK